MIKWHDKASARRLSGGNLPAMEEVDPGQMPQQVGKAVAAYLSADLLLPIVLVPVWNVSERVLPDGVRACNQRQFPSRHMAENAVL